MRSMTGWPVLRLVALYHRQNVAFGVLEPRALRAAARGDAVHGLEVRRVVFFEGHSSRFQLRDLALDILNLPERLARLGGTGVGRRVQETGGVLAKFVDHAP